MPSPHLLDAGEALAHLVDASAAEVGVGVEGGAAGAAQYLAREVGRHRVPEASLTVVYRACRDLGGHAEPKRRMLATRRSSSISASVTSHVDRAQPFTP